MSKYNSSTIRHSISLGYILMLLFFAMLFWTCRGRSGTYIPTANIDSALTQTYSLYRLIGYNELDTISKTFGRLAKTIEHYDSLPLKPPDYDRMLQIHEQLSVFISSFNEFHEEIYAIEDHLLFLENAYKSGEIKAAELRKRVMEENALLDDIHRRILLMRHKADSVASSLSTTSISRNPLIDL